MKQEREQEPQPLFIFKDSDGTFEIPLELKSLYDDLKKFHPKELIRPYVAALSSIALQQQEEYKDKNRDRGIRSKGQIDEYIDKRMTRLIELRDEAFELYGPEVMLKIELYLGVDSRGIEAGDKRPTLGVNLNLLASFFHYVIARDGEYEEIKTGS